MFSCSHVYLLIDWKESLWNTNDWASPDCRCQPSGWAATTSGCESTRTQTKAVVDKAIEVGITLFDTANIYGGTKSEEFLGEALGDRRRDIVLATKVG